MRETPPLGQAPKPGGSLPAASPPPPASPNTTGQGGDCCQDAACRSLALLGETDLYAKLSQWPLALLAASLITCAPGACRAQLINQFGNLVFPDFGVSIDEGIGLIDDPGVTGDPLADGKVAIADVGITDLGLLLALMIADVNSLPPTTDPAEIEERDAIVDGLVDIVELLDQKAAAGAVVPSSFVSGSFTINFPGLNDIVRAVGDLNKSGVVTSDSVNAAVAVIADVDPFLILSGSITNTSETESINAFLPFEEAFLSAMPLEAPVLRETFISASIEDTNGDGDASLGSASLSFEVQATTDPNNPSLANTDPVGLSERLSISRVTPGFEFTNQRSAQEIDKSTLQSLRGQLSHATGQVLLEQISPGDTANFTAILSLGVENDPLFPLIPVESLHALTRGVLITPLSTVPEPSSVLLAVAAAGLTLTSRHTRLKRP